MMNTMRHVLVIFVSLLTSMGAPAYATSLRPVSLDEMVKEADLIFIGTPVKKETAEQSGPLGSLTVDTWTFQVGEVLKAKEGLKAQIKAGGTFSWKQSRRVGTFTMGRDYCLYLSDLGNGLWATVGMIQGVFEIIKNPDGTQSVRNRMNNQLLFRGSKLKAASVAKGARQAVESGSGPIPLADFKQLVEMLKE